MKTKDPARQKIMLWLTGVLIVIVIILSSGFFRDPHIFRVFFDLGSCLLLLPFIIMYAVMWLLIYWGDIGRRVLLSKICGFSLVYLSYFFCLFYMSVIHPGVGAPIGLRFIFLSMPWMIPIVYAIGYGVGSVLFVLWEKMSRNKTS